MTNLQAMDPKSQVLVTSQMTLGGAQNKRTRKSARAKLTMNMLVTDCIDLVIDTAVNTCAQQKKKFCKRRGTFKIDVVCNHASQWDPIWLRKQEIELRDGGTVGREGGTVREAFCLA